MAQRVLTQLVSDLSGEDIKDGDGETLTFAIDGSTYEIDVTKKEGDDLRGAFMDYIAVARRIGRKTAVGKRTQTGPSAATIRSWANANGIEVPERGRIPGSVREAYARKIVAT